MSKNDKEASSALKSARFGSISSIFIELRKVNWPSFTDTVRLSSIVLLLSGFFAVFLGLGVDQFFAWLIALIGG